MASLNTYHPVRELAASNGAGLNKGFTLLETLVVMAIFIVLMGVGGVIAFNSYKGYLFRSERSTAVSVLERARSRAIANYYGEKHGVHYDDVKHEYVIFRGNTYISTDPNNERVFGNPNSVITNFGTIIFDRLSGNPNPSASGATTHCLNDEKQISVKEGDKESFICINNEGRINW